MTSSLSIKYFYILTRKVKLGIPRNFLLRFGCQKVCSITFIGKLHKRNIESFFLCNGDKTHESWKPLLNTIHAFRGLSECLHNETCNISFVQSASINLNADLLTPESYYIKNCASHFSNDWHNSLLLKLSI